MGHCYTAAVSRLSWLGAAVIVLALALPAAAAPARSPADRLAEVELEVQSVWAAMQRLSEEHLPQQGDTDRTLWHVARGELAWRTGENLIAAMHLLEAVRDPGFRDHEAFPAAQYFLAEMGIENFRYDFRLEIYLNFFTKLSLGLGIVFQLPILMLGLTRMGIAEPAHFNRYRGHFWVGSLVMAAILTPPDPYTQMMMAGPMALLYELGLLLARIGHRMAKKAAAEEGLA